MSKCLGCGYCCSKAPCLVGQAAYGPVVPCPGLVFKDGRFWCREVLAAEGDEEQWEQTSSSVGGIGAGCCSGLNSARPDSPFYNPKEADRIRKFVLSSLSNSSER